MINPHIRKIVKEELSGEKAKTYAAEITAETGLKILRDLEKVGFVAM